MLDIIEFFSQDLDLHKLECAMKELPSQIDCEVQHHFSHGIYARTISLPSGSLIMGKRHRFETCNILLKGEISIYMGVGKEVVHLKAPCMFNSKPGEKKLGYAHTDVLFTNIHPTEETDVDKIEELFIVSEEEYTKSLQHEVQKCLGEP